MPISFHRRIEIEQVRAIEEDCGALEYHNVSPAPGFTESLVKRAAHLKSAHASVAKALAHGPHVYHWVLTVLLLALALMGAVTSAQALATASDGTLNIFWILGILLGLNWIALVFWLIFSLALRNSSSGIIAPLVNQLVHWRAPKEKAHSYTAAASRAWLTLHFHPALALWRFGQITHLAWASYLSGGLLCLLFLLATQQFDFIWGSTLLGGQTFLDITQTLSQPMQALGIPVPTEEQVLASQRQTLAADPASARKAWAFFLLGCLVVYGLLPRALIWAFCWLMERRQQQRVQLNLNAPYYLGLQQKLWPHASAAEILDPDQAAPATRLEDTREKHAPEIPEQALWLGLELSRDLHWPDRIKPQQILGNVQDEDSLNTIMDRLREHPKSAIAILVDARRPADRGLVRTLGKIVDRRTPERQWLILYAPHGPMTATKLQAWLGAATQVGLIAQNVQPLTHPS